MKKLSVLVAVCMLALPAMAGEHQHHGHHSQHKADVAKNKKVKCTSTRAYTKAMDRMHNGMNIRYSGDADTDFVAGMIPHHQGAVDMAEVVLKHGKDEEVRDLARWIVTAQQQEIAFMERWLETRGVSAKLPENKKDQEAVRDLKAAVENMHKAMHIKYSGDADVDFVRGMIPHHQGAIDMAYALVRHGDDAEINALAWGIITSQEREIKQMKRWLERHGK